MTPTPGWYPDPAGHRGYRWWDGTQWTAHQYPPPPPAYPPSPGPGPGYWPRPAGGSLAGLARAGILLWLAGNAAFFGYALIDADHIHRAFAAWFNAINYASDVGAPIPLISDYYRFPPALYLVQSLGLVGTICIAVWQNRAAHQARWAGYPAQYSPVFGAWGWFIPVANFWVPYRAMRDCLPPGHLARSMALRSYIAWLLTPLAGLAAVVVAIAADRPAVTVVVAVVLVALVGLAAGGLHQVVTTIDRQQAPARPGP